MPVEIFFCYAREDKGLCTELEKQLRALKRQGIIDVWHDREIIAGTDWEREIDKHLNSAQIILLLVSPDFMDSDYCYSKEMTRAMERHERGEACVIPVIFRPVYWRDAPFGKLQALPTDAKPVTSRYWHNLDEAFFDVAEGIQVAVKGLMTKEQWFEECKKLLQHKQFEEVLAASEQAIRLDPSNAVGYAYKGSSLNKLKRYEEALAASEQAIQLDPKSASGYAHKSEAFIGLKRYEEALAASEQAIQLDPNFVHSYAYKIEALIKLGRAEEALAVTTELMKIQEKTSLKESPLLGQITGLTNIAQLVLNAMKEVKKNENE